ncbi:MAG TPA: type 1 glutamine amidotransferase domain-containing protein [Candidatus Polarisedimenticolia bacterium]|jgi:protease I|nr:type 1 glutamine amidotransferase domain-containing protein [Candidatus Polarisedimenticolia bacterium]
MSKGKVALLVENDYQDMEVWVPLYRLREEGYETVTVGPSAIEYKSKHGYPLKAQAAASEVRSDDFLGVVIPGGWAPDRLRQDRGVLRLVKDLFEKKRVVASICHGGWVLASAGVVRGKRLTSYQAIRDDLIHAGAEFVDQEVVRDGHLITSRKPDDLPAFCREIIKALREAQ